MQPAVERARALSDPTRLRLLALLLAGEATVNDLAAQLDLAQPRISTHLAILRRAGLVEAEASGRQHVYRVEPERVRPLLAALASCAEADRSQVPRSDAAARAVRGNTPLRQARTCYDHLAGVAGVGLLDELLRRDWLATEDGPARRFTLTRGGALALGARGLDLDRARKARRTFASGCLDWTERRPHLGGALGAALLDVLLRAGVVRREATGRAVNLVRPVTDWLDAPTGSG